MTMNWLRSQVFRSAALTATLVASLAGCSGAQRGGGGGAHTYTFENRSSSSLCQVWIQSANYESNGRAIHNGSLAIGGTVTLSLSHPAEFVFATECGSARTIIGLPDSTQNPNRRPMRIESNRIVLYDAGEAPSSPSDHSALEAAPMGAREWVDASLRMLYGGDSTPDVAHDAEMARDALNRVRNFARRAGWHEEFFNALVTTDGWVDTRGWRATWMGPRLNIVGRFYDALVGARWSDGHCTMQQFRFSQRGDGDNYESATQVAMGSQIPMPCAIVEAVSSEWDGAAN